MSDRDHRLSITRRRLFGAGAGAAAAWTVATPPAAATNEQVPMPPDGTGGLGAGAGTAHPMVAPTPLTGAAMDTIAKFDFVPTSQGGGSSLQIDSVSGGTFNSAFQGALVAPLNVPASARLRQIDAYGYRNGPPGVQNWYLRRVDMTGLIELVATESVHATGPIHLTFGGLDVRVGPGERLYVELSPSSPSSTALGAVFQYVNPAAGLVLFGDPSVTPDPAKPNGPVRVYDSRKDVARGKLGLGQTRQVNMAHELPAPDGNGRQNVVPIGARAIAYNLTITDTETTFGYLQVIPAGQSNFGASSINWDKANTTIANGLIVGISASREIVVRCDGVPATPAKTHFVIDVTGYFV
jgi:hypothetical protein